MTDDSASDRSRRFRAARQARGLRRVDLWVPEAMTDILRQALDHLDQAGPPTAAQLEHARSLGERLGEPLPSIATENAVACLLWIIAARARCKSS